MVVLEYSTNRDWLSQWVSQRHRPPSSKQNGFINSLLYTDNIAIIPYDALITGDVHFHVNKKSDVKLVGFTIWWIHTE